MTKTEEKERVRVDKLKVIGKMFEMLAPFNDEMKISILATLAIMAGLAE